jgi:hypothetical protein
MTRFDLRELLVDEEEGEVTLWEHSFLPIEHRRNARILKTNWGRRDPARAGRQILNRPERCAHEIADTLRTRPGTGW